MLDQFSRSVLDFERSWWQLPGYKHANVSDQLGCTAAEYYEVLGRLVDDPRAMEYDPLTVVRIRRLRNHPAGNASAQP
ncbi:DUF3263 domain-containing protein [soil metagenome]